MSLRAAGAAPGRGRGARPGSPGWRAPSATTNVGVAVDHQLGQRRRRPRRSARGHRSLTARQACSVQVVVVSRREVDELHGPACRSRPASGSTSRSSPTIRTPSSSSTSAITNGSSCPGTGGCVVHDVAEHRAACRRPRRSRGRRRAAAGHTGPAGAAARRRRRSCWIRSSPAAVPSQKNAVSGDDDRAQHAAIGSLAAGGSAPAAAAPCGRGTSGPGTHRRDRLVADRTRCCGW